MLFLSIFVSLAAAELRAADFGAKKHHHKHHHHHHHRHSEDDNTSDSAGNGTAVSHALVAAKATTTVASAATDVNATEEKIEEKMKELEAKMAPAAAEAAKGVKQGRIVVNGPLPTDFSTVFADAVASSTGCAAADVKIIETHAVAASPAFIQLLAGRKASAVAKAGGEIEVVFEAPAAVVDEVEAQAADPESKLVNGQLHDYLVAEDDAPATSAPAAAPMEIDTEMPYGELEPFGREDTAQELTDNSVKESDEMVDQLERSEVAEEKRAVFRALTRLRGAAITSYDGIARSQTGNIDEYNHLHKWRETHPLHHLADEESDVSKWAFPDNAD
jgi:hypothetical protein